MDDGMLFCSFCGKMQSEVRKLVAGPTAYICDECIELCRYIVEEEDDKLIEKDAQKALPYPKEIKNFWISTSSVRKKQKRFCRLPSITITNDFFRASNPTV